MSLESVAPAFLRAPFGCSRVQSAQASAVCRAGPAPKRSGSSRPMVTAASARDVPSASFEAAAAGAQKAFNNLFASQTRSSSSRAPTTQPSSSSAPVLPVVTDTDLEDELADLNLKVVDRIGKGSRATVFRCEGLNLRPPPAAAGVARPTWRASPGQVVAVKALVGEVTQESLAELISEAALWKELEHPGIVRVYHAHLSSVPLLVLEACEEGTLFSALRKAGAIDVRPLAIDVANALAAVHAAGQAHRDIKSANVLLAHSPEGRLQAKLCDWGSAARLGESLPSRPAPPSWPSKLFGSGGNAATAPTTWTPVGTALWMAPEMLAPHYAREPPTPGASGATADVHSFGVLLWELLERRLPWVEGTKVTRAEVLRVVVKEKRRLPISPWVHPDLAALMTQCWHVDPKQRPTMAQVAQRLEALPAWDTNGHLDLVAAGKVPPPNSLNDSLNKVVGLGAVMRNAVFGSAGQRPNNANDRAMPSPSTPEAPRKPDAAAAIDEDEEERLTLSETVPEVEDEFTAKPSAQALAASMAQALTSFDTKAGTAAEVLLSAVLPHAYTTVVSAPVKAELDTLVLRMKEVEARVKQLEERRKFDPLGNVLADGKRQELLDITTKVTTMRADAAVKAWAHVNALLADASAAAAKEYAAARQLAEAASAAAKQNAAAQGGKKTRSR